MTNELRGASVSFCFPCSVNYELFIHFSMPAPFSLIGAVSGFLSTLQQHVPTPLKFWPKYFTERYMSLINRSSCCYFRKCFVFNCAKAALASSPSRSVKINGLMHCFFTSPNFSSFRYGGVTLCFVHCFPIFFRWGVPLCFVVSQKHVFIHLFATAHCAAHNRLYSIRIVIDTWVI